MDNKDWAAFDKFYNDNKITRDDFMFKFKYCPSLVSKWDNSESDLHYDFFERLQEKIKHLPESVKARLIYGIFEDTDLLQEERVYNESIPDFDDPIALHKYLNTFEYRMLDSDLNKTNSSSSYRTISPTNFFKYKIGTCWDFVAAEAYYFRKAFANYKITSQDLKDNTYSLYFIQKDDSSKQTHTWLAYMKQNRITVIESAWGKMMGVHTFSSEEEMISKYIESFVSGSQKYILYKYHIQMLEIQ